MLNGRLPLETFNRDSPPSNVGPDTRYDLQFLYFSYPKGECLQIILNNDVNVDDDDDDDSNNLKIFFCVHPSYTRS
jgi:hypothetical protein